MGAIVTLGEAMVTFSVAGITPLRHASTASLSLSGSEATVAIGARRLGHRAEWISRLGDDEPGELIRSRMLGEGVTVHADRATLPTGLMLKEHPRAQMRRVHYYRRGSAATELSPADVPDGVIEGADVFHSSGITASLSPTTAATLIEGIRRARASRTIVSFDVNYRSKLWTPQQAREVLLPLLSSVDILFTSLDEAQLLLDRAGVGPEQLTAGLRRYGPPTVVITDGAAGAWLADSSGFAFAPALATTEVDPFGAGDAFVAGFLSVVLEAGSSEGTAGVYSSLSALARASAVASLAVSSDGDWEGLPDRSELGIGSAAGAADAIAR